ncbi:hypothetical protein J1605_006907 [Eschrichtius robustus]|uniref:Uncharacterized protein n=1 Tax=Eschrichtius robustus TaxID=9764 RepID=A0AB34H430_ESCRO|nr:hypothetical protein J1605_006907 [Eschrichtius robustus]
MDGGHSGGAGPEAPAVGPPPSCWLAVRGRCAKSPDPQHFPPLVPPLQTRVTLMFWTRDSSERPSQPQLILEPLRACEGPRVAPNGSKSVQRFPFPGVPLRWTRLAACAYHKACGGQAGRQSPPEASPWISQDPGACLGPHTALGAHEPAPTLWLQADQVFLCFQNVKETGKPPCCTLSLLMRSYEPAEVYEVPLSPLVSRRGYACGLGSQAGLDSHTLSLFNAQQAPL